MAMLTGAEVRAVDIQGGQARGVEVRMRDGAQARIAGGVVALGANAIFNAAILLRSGLTSPALGRYLHEQASATIDIDIDAPNYFGGTSITSHCYAFYDGAHRRDAGAVLIENYNAPSSLRHEPGKWTQRMQLRLMAEDLPQAENLVRLGDDDEPHVIWTGHSDLCAGRDRAGRGGAGQHSAVPHRADRQPVRDGVRGAYPGHAPDGRVMRRRPSPTTCCAATRWAGFMPLAQGHTQAVRPSTRR